MVKEFRKSSDGSVEKALRFNHIGIKYQKQKGRLRIADDIQKLFVGSYTSVFDISGESIRVVLTPRSEEFGYRNKVRLCHKVRLLNGRKKIRTNNRKTLTGMVKNG